jgi:hypothetical protein
MQLGSASCDVDAQARVSKPPIGEWSDDDYDVLAGGVVVGRIMRAAASPEGTPWLWTLALWAS